MFCGRRIPSIESAKTNRNSQIIRERITLNIHMAGPVTLHVRGNALSTSMKARIIQRANPHLGCIEIMEIRR